MKIFDRIRGLAATCIISLVITPKYITKAFLRGKALSKDRNSDTLRAVNRVPHEWTEACERWGHHLCLRMITRVEGVDVLTDLVRQGKSVIIMSNHPSMAELHPWFAAITTILKDYVLRVVVKKELGKTPIGWAAKMLDNAWWFIDREGGQESIAQITDHMLELAQSERQFAAIIYPDGTKPTPSKVSRGQKFLHKKASSEDVTDRPAQYAAVLGYYNTTAVPRDGGLRAMILAAKQAGIDVELVFVAVRSPLHVARDGGFFRFCWSLVEQSAAMIRQPQEMDIERLDFNMWSNWAENDPIKFRMSLLRLFANTNKWIAERSNTVPLGKQIDSQ